MYSVRRVKRLEAVERERKRGLLIVVLNRPSRRTSQHEQSLQSSGVAGSAEGYSKGGSFLFEAAPKVRKNRFECSATVEVSLSFWRILLPFRPIASVFRG
jgi:hypothetical protein